MRLALVILLAGCLPDMDPASYVTGLRVLGVKADPPEIAPGQTTTLDTLAVDTMGRMIALDWSACRIPPQQGMSLSPDCVTADGGDALLAIGSGTQLSVTLPPTLAPGSLGLPDNSGGVYLPLIAHASAGEDTLTASYRLRVSFGLTPPNQNPKLDGILVVPDADAGMSGDPTAFDESAPRPIHANDTITLRAAFAPGSAEMYSVAGHMLNEQLSAAWFATAGSFSGANSGDAVSDTRFRLDKHVPDPGTIIDLWVVGRDERGGADWQHRQFLVQ